MQPSKTESLRYLRETSRIIGKDRDTTGGQKEKQAAYSLSWYFYGFLPRDLDQSSDSYAPLLDAYLHKNQGPTVLPAHISEADLREEERLLDECFPQSKYPLNDCQREAVHKALHNPVTVVIGPPGTGKTETILHMLALAVSRGETAAMVSSNHSAVDTVIKKLQEAVESPCDDQRDLKVELARHFVKLGNKSDRENACYASGESLGVKFESGTHHVGATKIYGWEQRLTIDDLRRPGEGVCIASTIHSLKKCFADGDTAKYDLLIMDEASQSSVLLGIVAMSCAKRIVIVGDDDQLPPVVPESIENELVERLGQDFVDKIGASHLCTHSEVTSFLASALEVFCPGRTGDTYVMLNKHYRCHPQIIGFCQKHIYGAELQIESEPSDESPAFPLELRWYEGDYRECDVRWEKKIDKQTGEDRGRWRTSVANYKQLRILQHEEMDHIRDLAERGKSICFLAPFWAQVEAVRELLEQDKKLKDLVEEVSLSGEQHEEGSHNDADVALTIHKAQGKEFDCVYLLPVEDGLWEWPWSQGKRLVNVAVSRAKEELHVICSTKLMSRAAQIALAGHEVPRKDVNEDEAPEKLFVQQLCDYIIEQAAATPADGPCFGVRRTQVVSVFDRLQEQRGENFERRDEVDTVTEDLQNATEQLVREALEHMCGQKGMKDLAIKNHVLLTNIVRETDGKALGENAPDGMHFDFVVYKWQSGRIVAAIEVDGAQHRFGRFDGDDRGDALARIRNDVKKEDIVRNAGGTLAWLGRPNGHQLPEARPSEARRDEGSVRILPGRKPTKGIYGRLSPWKWYPNRIPKDSSFIFVRIPTDGSTCFEFEELQAAAPESHQPPTVEGYVRRQLGIARKNAEVTSYVLK